jgi:choline dehydrogenase-like flavoprotein
MSVPSTVPGVLGNDSLSTFDVLIIGSGAGGSAAAYKLTAEKTSWNVLILEAGVNPFPGLDRVDGHTVAGVGGIPWPLFSNDELKMSIRGFVRQDPLLEPRTFRQTESDTAKADPDVNVLTRNVGGAAVISGVGYPRFTEVDFRLDSALAAAGRSYSNTSFADWPLAYGDLVPFYEEAERLSGVAGTAEGPDADPFSSRGAAPFPMPPQPPMYVGRVLANGAKELGRGYSPFNLPSAVNTQPYDGRSPCVSCGYCSGYGCARHAKGSPAVTTLRKALLTGRCQLRYNAHVTQLLLEGSRVTGVEYVDDNGQTQTARADRVILAASPIESVRLCLLSDPSGPGVGNSAGHLGRHMTFHYQTIGVGIFKQRLHGDRGRSVTHAISDFRGIMPGGVDLAADRPLGGIVEFGTSSEPITAARQSLRPEALAFASLRQVSLKQLLVESPFNAHIAVMIMQGEDAPQPTNRIDLDPSVTDIYGQPVPRLTYKNHKDFELAASSFYKQKMLDILEAAGAQFGFFSPFDPAVPPQSRHVLGGLRMGTDPTQSVCDPYGKFHDIANLYCADGGVFVTGSGYNPTLTIIAVALRTAASMT